MTYYPK
jgi:hypothetical protein